MKKKIAIATIFTLALSSATVLHAEDLSTEDKIIALEQEVQALSDRISQLELLILDDHTNITEFVSTSFNISPGIYVGGEDIPVGDYSFKVILGQGSFDIYTSYEDYANDESGFYYKDTYALMDESTRNSFIEQGFGTVAAPYSTELGNIKITEGLCISIDGVTLEATRK